MTLSLVAVFIPLLFMGGMNGRLFREFSITLSIAILISGFISIALTPMLCSRFLLEHTQETTMQKYGINLNNWILGYYKSSLNWCIHHSKWVFLIAFVCIGLTVYLFPKLSVQLIPPEDRGFLFSFVQLPSGTIKEDTKSYQLQLNTLIQKNPNVANFLDIAMEGNLIFLVRLHPLNQRLPQSDVITSLQKSFDAVPGIKAFTQGYQLINFELNFGSGVNTPY